MVDESEKIIDGFNKQREELDCKILRLSEQLQEKTDNLAKKEKRITELEKKIKNNKGEESEEQHENSEDDIKELKRKLFQLNGGKKELEGEVSDEHQEHIYLNSEIYELRTREKEYLSKIKKLEKELLSLKADKEELVNQSINVKDDYKKNVNKFEEKKREYVTKTVFTVLSVVKERVKQGLFNLEEQDMQDTDRIQEGVDKFMQPIYEKLGINNQLDISSGHPLEFEGADENKLANGLTFPKPLFPHTSTPRRCPRKSLSPKKKDNDENKENSEQSRSPHTSFSSHNLSPFKDTTNNSYHTLKM